MKRKTLLSVGLALAMTLSTVSPALAAEAETDGQTASVITPSEDDIVILYTNDVHTYIANDQNKGHENDLTYSKIAGWKKSFPEENVLLVDAGDHVQGTAYGSMDKGATISALMNAAGYDVATLGNHEFDYGMDGAMAAIERAEFPYVSCNFYHETNGVPGERVLDAYTVLEAGGKKIAFVGITTPESFTKSTPAYFQDEEGNYIYGIAGGADGQDLYQTVQTAIDAAAQEADYVIGLGHLGIDPSSVPWTSKEVIANTTGLDAFIDGHSHSTVAGETVADKEGNSVVLTQTGCYFNALGEMIITPEGKIVTQLRKGEDLVDYTPDAGVQAIESQWIAEIDTQLGQKIGHISDTLTNYDEDGNRLVRKQETNTGDFCADALYYLFDNMDLDVDFAVMNGGGIRNTSTTGDLTYKTCKEIHTFGNVACLITITGQQMLDALEWGAKDANAAGTYENGGFLHVSGLKYTIDLSVPSTVQQDEKGVWTGGPTGEYRVKDVQVLNQETGEYQALDLEAKYNLAGYNYTLRDLGDGFNMFAGAVNVLDYVSEDYMVLADYIRSFENGEVVGYAEPAGRITLTYTLPDDMNDPEIWWYDAAAFCLQNGILQGTDQGFQSELTLTRAQVLQTIFNMAVRPGSEMITDTVAVSEDLQWADEALDWAASVGLFSGTEYTEDLVISRAETAALLSHYVDWVALTQEIPEPLKSETQPDTSAVPEECLEGVTFCYDAGIMVGDENGDLMPAKDLTRAEWVQILINLDAFLAGSAVKTQG